jgi:hypothetical protein
MMDSPTAGLLLIAGVAMERSGTRACGGSDGGTFKRASRLVTDDTACGGSALGVGAGRGRTVGKSKGRCGTGDDEQDVFHDLLDIWTRLARHAALSRNFRKMIKF